MNDQFELSFIDRLCETRHSASISEMREYLRRDLEDLLNTRQGCDNIPQWCEQLRSSIAVYGLHNIETVDISSQEELLRLLSDIKNAIIRFEPRLENVEVSITKDESGKQAWSPFILHLRIDAEMRMGNYLDRVVFNTMIQKSGATVQEALDHA